MSKFVDKCRAKYTPKKIGDNIIIPSKKYKGFFGAILALLAIFGFLFLMIFIDEDFYVGIYILGVITVLIAFWAWVLEKTKYVIAPDHIAIKHGLFGRKIQFDQIASYSSITGNVLFFYYTNGKEIKIVYDELHYEAKNYFRNVIKANNIPEKVYSDCQDFKMHKIGRAFWICLFGGLIIFLDYIMVSSEPSDSEIFAMIIMMIIFNFILFCVIFSFTYTIYVHDKRIEVKNFGIPIKSFNVVDIYDYESRYVTYKNSKVEELAINMKNEDLGLFFPTISRKYSNYERLIGYIKANGILTVSELKALNAKNKPKAKKINENQNKINLKKRRRRHTL